MIAIQKTVKPMWEVRSTYDICADIAGHLGLREQYTEGRTQAQWAEMHYQQIRENAHTCRSGAWRKRWA